jgi:peptidyl-prolyl cis-trans isomerase B (cyclophilin B)
VAPSRNRQRALARAKLERQIARRAAAARKRRQLRAALGAGIAVVLVIVGVIWVSGGFSSKKHATSSASGDCAWTREDPAGNPNLKDVGMPPTKNIPKAGNAVMTITTNQGVIKALLDRAQAPCTVASFSYLAARQFFDNSKCHRLTTQGLFVLQCGDPSGTGSGGPAYRFPTEYVPPAAPPSGAPSASPQAEQSVTYRRAALAMANSGPDTNGSQFFIVYRDSPLPPSYTLFGTVTEGIEIVDKIAKAGVNASDPSKAGDGPPRIDVVVQSLTVTETTASAQPAPTGAAPTGPTPSGPTPSSPAAGSPTASGTLAP